MNVAAKRRVSFGAALYIVATVQFLIGMTVAVLYYGPPPYDLQQNSISDLQAVSCGLFQGNQVCSPLHTVANSSVAILGLLLVAGTVSDPNWIPGRKAMVGRARSPCPGRSGRPCKCVHPGGRQPHGGHADRPGGVPRRKLRPHTDRKAHVQRFRAPRLSHLHRGLRVVGLAALILYGAGVTGPLGPGGMEWLIVAPILLWAFVMGIHLLRFPQSAGGHPGVTALQQTREGRGSAQ